MPSVRNGTPDMSDAVDIWKLVGLSLDPSTIEVPGVYSVGLVLGDRDPATEIAGVRRALEATEFRNISRRDRGRLGVLPTIMAIPGTASIAMKRGDDIVVAYARRAGLPASGSLPCRLVLILDTARLLGPWAERGLAEVSKVTRATDEQLAFEAVDDADRVFDGVLRALTNSGARVAVPESECLRRFTEHMREQVRRAGVDPDTIDVRPQAPREVHLEDRDGSELRVSTEPSGGVVATRVVAPP